MGRIPSVFAAACLTLEFVGAAGAVSRSWGDKVVEYIQNTMRNRHLGLFDLIAIGMGATIGSGIFVLRMIMQVLQPL